MMSITANLLYGHSATLSDPDNRQQEQAAQSSSGTVQFDAQQLRRAITASSMR
jgi:hypothetical protein